MSLVASREREFWHSTDAIEYCIKHTELRLRVVDPLTSCAGLFIVSVDGNPPRNNDEFVCVDGEGRTEEDYYKTHGQELIAKLRCQYPDLSTLCAERVADTITELLVIGNASHHCPQFGGFTTITSLHIMLKPRSSHTEPLPVELIIREGERRRREEDDEEEEEEEDEAAIFCPRMRPATRASITELLLKAKAEPDQGDADCGICMEGIHKDRVVRMPCSHPFHRFCLLHWLDSGHSCPICRYQLPAAHHLSDRSM